MPKIIGFLRRRPDFDHDAFSRHWRTVHRAHAEKLRRWLTGYVQAHYRSGPVPDVQRPADGSPLLWVEALADLAELAASPECRDGATLDEPLFMEGRSSGLVVEEAVLIPRPAFSRDAVKLMAFAYPRPGTSRATIEGSDGWLCPTANASGRIVNHAIPDQAIDPGFGFGAVEEIWWPDAAAFHADWATARVPASVAWLEPAGFKAAFVDEIEVFTPPASA